MRNALTISLCTFILLLSIPSGAWAKEVPREPYRFMSAPTPVTLPNDVSAASPSLVSAVADTVELAWFTFEVLGIPNAQGWTPVDLTEQLDTFFHVADATELTGGAILTPLDGSRSMWCGVSPSAADPFCGWATLPGYGNGWDQRLFTGTLNGDSVTVSYKVAWDAEPGYDGTRLQYSGDGGATWFNFPVNGGAYFGYEGIGSTVEAWSAGGLGTVDLRFVFTSDGAWSDQDGLWPTDGAVVLDSITIETFTGGVSNAVYFSDFEGAAPGAHTDGIWTGGVRQPFGSFAALYPGINLLQEDQCNINYSAVWGFFDDPISTNYACHTPDPRPDVGAIPFGTTDGVYIHNEIWSPLIPYIGSGSEAQLRFRVYRDLPLDNLVFFIWHVRSWIGACASDWLDNNFVFYGADRDWSRQPFQLGTLIQPGAESIQVALGVIDMCAFWCNTFGSGSCHSHAPLFDDVRVLRIDRTGPQFTVRHLELFQDNFAEDGTLTGTARADAAQDIGRYYSAVLQPGDSVTITVADPNSAVAMDPLSGSGSAVYLYAAIWPQGQAGKSGLELEAPEMRGATKRYPLVDSLQQDGVWWYCFRGDSAITGSGSPVIDRYCFDLRDNVLTPGDTVCYFFCAENTLGERSYWTRTMNGQGVDLTTNDLTRAATSPCEFTILPAGGWQNGGYILYVDDTDDRGGPSQLFFDTAFEHFGILDQVDRYDVLAPSSSVGNSLASRVRNVPSQVITPYEVIIWDSGNLSIGLLGDGGTSNNGSGPEKSDDYALVFQFLDNHPNDPGLFLSGDNIADEWVDLYGPQAINTRSIFMNFNLVNGDHVSDGEPVSPLLTGVGPCFNGDQLIAYGGCPLVNRFDLLQPTGLAVTEFRNASTGKNYMISQSTPNAAASIARVFLSGFGYSYIRDLGVPGPLLARVRLLEDMLICMGKIVPVATGLQPAPQFANRLDAAYPNPFNPTTTIGYEIREAGLVSLRVYNAAGQLVRTLVNEIQTPQTDGFEVRWDGRSNAGGAVSSGVYFYELVAKNYSSTRKMVLLK